MPLITILVYLVILGLILYLIELLPLEPTIRLVIRVIVILALILYLLQFLPLGELRLR